MELWTVCLFMAAQGEKLYKLGRMGMTYGSTHHATRQMKIGMNCTKQQLFDAYKAAREELELQKGETSDEVIPWEAQVRNVKARWSFHEIAIDQFQSEWKLAQKDLKRVNEWLTRKYKELVGEDGSLLQFRLLKQD